MVSEFKVDEICWNTWKHEFLKPLKWEVPITFSIVLNSTTSSKNFFKQWQLTSEYEKCKQRLIWPRWQFLFWTKHYIAEKNIGGDANFIITSCWWSSWKSTCIILLCCPWCFINNNSLSLLIIHSLILSLSLLHNGIFELSDHV